MERIVREIYFSMETDTKMQHFHNCHQIVLVLEGQVEICVNGISLYASKGDAIIFSRQENHSVRILSEAYQRYVLHIAPNIANQNGQAYSLLTDRPAGFCNIINVCRYMDDLIGICKGILRERENQRTLAEEMEQLLVKQLLILLCRCAPVQFEGFRDSVVTKIKSQFEKYCSKPYTLAALAREYSISVSSLSHRFRAVTGVSVMEYLQACRMAQAKQLLAYTDKPVGEIVELCGFLDNSNFSRTFKALNGISPSAFRRKYGVGI